MLYRESQQLVPSCLVAHALSSDHLPVVCRLNVASPQRQLVFRELRNIKAINRNALTRDVAAMVHTQPELTAQQLNDELRSLLVKHAPATRRRVGPLRGTPVSARSYALPSVSAAGPSGGGSILASPLINRFTVLLKGLLQTLCTKLSPITSLLR